MKITFRHFFALTIFALGAGQGRATDLWSGTPSAPCDFFQAQLIGEYCARTAYLGVYGDYTERVVTNSGARNTFHTGDEGATLAVSPWQGVRLTVQDEALQANSSVGFETFPVNNIAFYTPALKNSASGAGYIDVGADVTVWDRQDAASRYIVSVFGHLATVPASGVTTAQDRQELGWQSGARWRLGASGLSVDYLGSTYLRRYDNPNDVQLLSTNRLLLASDAFGVALGPELVTVNELGHDPSLKLGWSTVALGGRAIVEPFRMTQVPVLRDLTFDAYGLRYIGQAQLVAPWVGSASAYQVGGSMRVNVRF